MPTTGVASLLPVVEINGFTTIDEGNRTPGVNYEGVDALNFGSTRSGTVITGATGMRYRLTDSLILGTAYEAPLTEREDLLGWRAYFDVVWHFEPRLRAGDRGSSPSGG